MLASARLLLSSRSRRYCTSVPTSKEKVQPHKIAIPRSELDISYTRSSGPGGQNVNKRSTKAEVRFSLSKALWMPDEVKDAFRRLNATYIVSQDTVVVTSQKHRTQPENERSCIHKLQECVNEACLLAAGLPTRSDVKQSRIQKAKAKSRSRALKKVKTVIEGGGTKQEDVHLGPS